MKILAIDTSSKNATVAITENEEKLIELNNSDEKTHSQKLMPMIDEALKKTEISLDDINLLVCCLGPGSFTGVRIGIATAKAFSDSKNILVAGVSSLEELAYNIKEEGYICSLIDAGHGNTYAGFFYIRKDKNNRLCTIQEDLTFLDLKDENGNISEERLEKYIEKSILNIETNQKNIENLKSEAIYFVGDATIKYSQLFNNFTLEYQKKYEIKLANPNQNIPSGITLAQIGYTKYKNGQYGDSSILAPMYLRKSQAEIALENTKIDNKKEI